MLQMHVPKYLWAEASSSICHQQNSIWCYHKGKIPWEIFHGGASALCPDSLRDQLSPKAHCSVHIAFCILLGYSPAMLWSSYDFISFGMLHSWRMSLCILMILLMHCLISVQMWDSLLPSVVPLGRPVLRQRHHRVVMIVMTWATLTICLGSDTLRKVIRFVQHQMNLTNHHQLPAFLLRHRVLVRPSRYLLLHLFLFHLPFLFVGQLWSMEIRPSGKSGTKDSYTGKYRRPKGAS